MIVEHYEKSSYCQDRSYDHFIETAKSATKKGYMIGGFGKLQKLKDVSKAIIMRHDIDFSPQHALRMAGIEDFLGISATYFISMHRPHYSPLHSSMRKTIHALIEHGQEIGLHYEPEFDDLPAEIVMLQRYLGCEIVAIARHNPFGNKIDIDSANKPHHTVDAYGPEVSEFKYISDSSGIWRENCWCSWLSKKDKLQVLIHPEWHNGLTTNPVEQLENINQHWRAGMDKVAAQAIENLRTHRQKIEQGLA